MASGDVPRQIHRGHGNKAPPKQMPVPPQTDDEPVTPTFLCQQFLEQPAPVTPPHPPLGR